MNRLLKKMQLAAIVAAWIVCGGAADAATYTWKGARNGAYQDWSSAANWVEGAPPNNGTADIYIENEPSGDNNKTFIRIDQPWSIRSIKTKQGNGRYATMAFSPDSKTLTIGAGGVVVTNYLATFNNTDIHGEGDDFAMPITFSASQNIFFMHDGAGHVGQPSLYHQFKGDWTAASGVNVTLEGRNGKFRFAGGSSTGFLGHLIVKRPVIFAGASQFSRGGTGMLVMSAENTSVGTTAEPTLYFNHTASGTGEVMTPIRFECLEAGKTSNNVRPGLNAALSNGELDTKTVFRGAWTGIVRGYDRGLVINGPCDQYGGGDLVQTAYANGIIRPENHLFVFDNDTTALTVTNRYVNGDGTVSGEKNIFITDAMLMFNRQSALGTGYGHKFGFSSEGFPGHVRGMLLGNGANFNASNQNGWLQINEPAQDSNIESGVFIFGAGAPGTCSFGTINLQKCRSGYGAEQALWLYAVTNSTVTFGGTFVKNGSGSGRYLPTMVKGGGTVILNQSYMLGANEAPYWVRSGRLLVNKLAAIDRTSLRLGAPVREVTGVRAIYMRRMSGVATGGHDTTDKITFSTMPTADGVTLETGDRVLVNIPDIDYSGANSPRENRVAYNGIYLVDAEAKTWTRVTELDSYEKCLPELAVEVEEGSRFAGTRWFLHNSHYYIQQRLNLPTMPGGFWSLTFHQEDVPDNDIALMINSSLTVTNTVYVSDNKSAGRSILGVSTATTAAWSGEKHFEKDVTVSAPALGRCTLSAENGLTYGSCGINKIGGGEVVIKGECAGDDPEHPTFVITNLFVAEGTLSVSTNLLASKSAAFQWSAGGSLNLKLEGDVNLSGWAIDVKGVPAASYERGEEPAAFEVNITSSNGGTVTGTPAFPTLPRRWKASEVSKGRYRVVYHHAGATISLR